MTKKNLALWVVVAALFLICLYSEVRQGSSAVKYIGRITLLTAVSYTHLAFRWVL